MDASNEPAALRRARLVIAYDGAPFHGFAEAAGVPTVLGTLREALERVLRTPLELVGAGRTDAGVHAWGQVVSGDLPAGTDLDDLRHRVNRMCSPAVVVRAADWADDPAFHARFSAAWRHYRYDVLNAPVAVPALATTTWHVPRPLKLWAMQGACDPIIGEHDFTSFCRAPKVAPGATPASMRRRVLRADWTTVHSDYGPVLRFEIRANAFCQQMVRSLVGTMVDIGQGRIGAGEMMAILHSRDRRSAGQVAPPHGLSLWDVGFAAADD